MKIPVQTHKMSEFEILPFTVRTTRINFCFVLFSLSNHWLYSFRKTKKIYEVQMQWSFWKKKWYFKISYCWNTRTRHIKYLTLKYYNFQCGLLEMFFFSLWNHWFYNFRRTKKIYLNINQKYPFFILLVLEIAWRSEHISALLNLSIKFRWNVQIQL